MFPLFMPMLIGAGLGAVINKKDPLKGALLGAGAGALGGTAVPGLTGAAGATSGAGLTASPGVGLSLGSSSGGLGLNAGGLVGEGLKAPATGLLSPASTSVASPSLLGQFKEVAAQAKPFGDAAGAAMTVKGLLDTGEPMAPPPPPVVAQPLDLSGVLNSQQQEMARTFEEDMKRRQAMSQYAQYAMGGR